MNGHTLALFEAGFGLNGGVSGLLEMRNSFCHEGPAFFNYALGPTEVECDNFPLVLGPFSCAGCGDTGDGQLRMIPPRMWVMKRPGTVVGRSRAQKRVERSLVSGGSSGSGGESGGTGGGSGGVSWGEEGWWRVHRLLDVTG